MAPSAVNSAYFYDDNLFAGTGRGLNNDQFLCSQRELTPDCDPKLRHPLDLVIAAPALPSAVTLARCLDMESD